MTRSKLAAAVILTVALPARATRLPVRVYTTVDGLARDAVTCIVSDSKGFLWFCTGEGVSRYDGYQFVTYGMAQGLAHRSVDSVLESRSGAYLIGTDLGVSRLDPAVPPTSSKRFVSILPAGNQSALQIHALLESRSGEIFCATSQGLYRIANLDSPRPVMEAVPLTAGPPVVVSAVQEDSFGNLWAGTSEGVCRRSPGGGVQWYAGAPSNLPREYIRRLLVSRKNDVWVGTLRGIWKFHIPAPGEAVTPARHFGTRDGLASARIHSLFESPSDGTIWIGTAGGLSQLVAGVDGRERFQSYSPAEGLSGRAVLSLNEDQQGNLWAGVDHGLTRIARDGFSTYTKEEGIGGLSMVEVQQTGGLLWALSNQTSALVLHYFEHGRFMATRPRFPEAMRYFGWASQQGALRDREGEWWIATGEGLCRFPRLESIAQLAVTPPKAVYTTRNGLPENDVFRLFEDARGDIWITTLAGQGLLTRWDRRSNSFHSYSAAEVPGVPSAFVEDRAGNLWIGLSNEGFRGKPSGLLRYRDGRLEKFTDAGSGPLGWILALFIDHSGRMWVGSTDGGLSRMDDPTADHPAMVPYKSARGALSSVTVHCITEDPMGRIYVGTPHGVDRIEPVSGAIKHYTTADGLTGGTPAALYCDRAGNIWIGGSMGLSVLKPSPDRPVSAPRVFITGLAVNGESRAIAEPGVESVAAFRLRPDQRQVRVEFVGVGGSGESIQYQYRLEGDDADWSGLTAQRSVGYAGLGPGRFRFLVRAVTGGGMVYSVPAQVSFEILGPLWRQWWFLSIMTALLCGMALLAHRYDVTRRLEVERMRIRIATDLHDDLGASLSRVAILTELVKRRTAPLQPESGRSLSEIAEIARGMVDGLGDLVWSIDPRRDDLSSMVRRVRGYASDVLDAQGIYWTFLAPSNAALLRLLPDQRRHLLLIFQEAIRNAARHSGCSSVSLSLEFIRGECIARIADNGRGLPDPQPDSGNGLMNMRARAAALGGTLSVSSRPGAGAELTVRFSWAARNGLGRIRMLFRGAREIGANRS